MHLQVNNHLLVAYNALKDIIVTKAHQICLIAIKEHIALQGVFTHSGVLLVQLHHH